MTNPYASPGAALEDPQPTRKRPGSPAMGSKILRRAAAAFLMVLGFLAVLALGFVGQRLAFVLVGFGFVAALGFRSFRSRRVAVLAFGAICVATLLSPLDVTFRSAPGPPRIVPVVFGLPTAEARAAAGRGERVLAGCVVTGFEPRWAIVW